MNISMGETRSVLPIMALSLVAALASGQQVGLDPRDLGLDTATASALSEAIESASWAAAESILLEASNTRAANADLQRALGIAHFQAGRPFSTAAALKRSDSLSPLDADARFLLATAFLRLERQHWARAELERLVAGDGSREQYRLALARVHYDQQRFHHGVEVLSHAIKASEASAEAHDLLGQCLEGLGQHKEAARAYRKAIAVGGTPSPWPHFHLGSLLHDAGNLGPAEESLRTATTIDPDNAPAHKELGLVLRKAGKLQASAKALEIASRLSPADPTIPYALAGLYRLQGLSERSATSMRRFRELSGKGTPNPAASEETR